MIHPSKVSLALAASTIVAASALVASATSAPALGGINGGGGPTGSQIRDHGTSGIVPDQYIVTLKDGSADAAKVQTTASGLTSRFGGKVTHSYSKVLHGFAAQMSAAQAQEIAGQAEVKSVQPVHKVTANDTQSNPPSWGLDRIDQPWLPLDNSYSSPSNANPPANTVTAYVIDTGIRITNGDFGGRASHGFNAFDQTTNADDCNGHGTHVAGTIGGTNYGVAKQVKLVAVKVLDCTGSGTDATVIAGIEWVTANAVKPAVANMSLGGDVSPALDQAVANSINAGITYTLAAGNEFDDAKYYSPARVASAITVGATDSTDTKPRFSNFGATVDIFAPGVSIVSDFLDGTATLSGTSMAAPHVAGAAAQVLAANPTFTPQQMRDYLVETAHTDMVTSPGFGSPNKLLNLGTVKNKVLMMRAWANSRAVTSQNGWGPVIANRDAVAAWEQFDLVSLPNGNSALRSHANGKYVAAESAGTASLVANRDAVGAWEQFQFANNSDGSFSIKAVINGRYVTAENAGNSPLIANRDAIGLWEKFEPAVTPNTVSLGAISVYKFVCADNAGNSWLVANRDSGGLWETFDAVDLGGGWFALRAWANGRYVTAENVGNSPLIANRSAVGAWEKFKFVDNGDGTVALFANANNRYVSNNSSTASPLIANRTSVGTSEKFIQFS